MKKIFGKVMVLVCILMGAASAQAETQVRIWQKSSGEGLPDFKATLKQIGYEVTDEGIKSLHLGYAAFDGAVKENLLDLVDYKCRTKEAFANCFLEFAFGKKIPKVITWRYFWIKGQGNVGWRLPVDNKLAKQVQALEHKYVTLRLQVKANSAGNQSVTDQVSSFNNRLDKVDKDLKAAEEAFQKGILTQPTIDSINGQIDTVGDQVKQLEVVAATQGNQIFFLAGGLIFGFLLIWNGIHRTRKNETNIQALDERIKVTEETVVSHEKILTGTNDRPKSGLVTKVAQLDARFVKNKDNIGKLKERQRLLSELVSPNVTFDTKDLKVALESLTLEKTTALVGNFIDTGENWLLDFELTSDGLVQIHGIIRRHGSDDLLQPCSNDVKNIASKIRKAGFELRLKGMESPSVLSVVPIVSNA